MNFEPSNDRRAIKKTPRYTNCAVNAIITKNDRGFWGMYKKRPLRELIFMLKNIELKTYVLHTWCSIPDFQPVNSQSR